jgi:bifunctional non-homologous end joining protein LigD
VQYADYSIIDLDPGPRAPFTRVIEVAHAVKEVLHELGLRAIPKTSGASGIHIVMPLPPHVPNDGARMIAEIVATMVVARAPRIATIERAVAARPKATVYVDFLQNIRGKTVAAVYSARAQAAASVSTPLRWKELTSDLDPREFTITTVPDRIREVGDLWAPAMRRPNSLEGVLAHG